MSDYEPRFSAFIRGPLSEPISDWYGNEGIGACLSGDHLGVEIKAYVVDNQDGFAIFVTSGRQGKSADRCIGCIRLGALGIPLFELTLANPTKGTP